MKMRKPAEVFHPGEYLRDELEARNWSQVEFAEIIKRNKRTINEIINGKRGISPDTAREIGAALGTSAELWMNLDNAYNLWKSDKDVSDIEKRAMIWEKFPIREMINKKWILHSEDTKIIEGQILRFFEIDNINLPPLLDISAFAKKSNQEEKTFSKAQLAWLYRVKQIAQSIKVPPYSREKLVTSLSKLSLYRANLNNIELIPKLLNDCGIKFIIVEPLKSSKIDGVCFWTDDSSPVIGMTIRFDRIDNFWFVLRHEIEHILNNDGINSTILDTNIFETFNEAGLSKEEKLANSAASEFCVPQEELDFFIKRKGTYLSRKELIIFSKSMGVHPGLVAGQIRWKTNRYDRFSNLLTSIRERIITGAITDGYGQNYQATY